MERWRGGGTGQEQRNGESEVISADKRGIKGKTKIDPWEIREIERQQEKLKRWRKRQTTINKAGSEYCI